MKEKRRVIVFILLVTLSSVKALNFEYSTSAYKTILTTERLIVGNSYTDATGMEFPNMEVDQNFVKASIEDVGEDYPKGLHFFRADSESDRTALSDLKYQKGEPEIIFQISIIFTTISHPKGKTTFGNLMICFKDSGGGSHQSSLVTYMFSAPKTPISNVFSNETNVTDADLVPEYVNPLSQDQVTTISETQRLKWKLSSMETLLLKPIRRGRQLTVPNETAYVLKPIIVDHKLLEQYFQLANPENTDPNEIKKLPKNLVRMLQKRELGDQQQVKSLV